MADSGESAKASKRGAHKFQAPKGTRDFYPEDMLRKRYIVETWRAVSLRHGFEEIDGPTFEHLDLYTVKSGEGIVSELFSFRREGGEDTYALRPEFTPTLARMYAARAAQLPKPVRWFCVPSFFRAERPQRGRLREFLQWNCDVIGGGGSDSTAEGAENAEADGEIVGVAVGAMDDFGIADGSAEVRFNDRMAIHAVLDAAGIPADKHEESLRLFDASAKLGSEFTKRADAIGIPKVMQAWFVSELVTKTSLQEAIEQSKAVNTTLFDSWKARLMPLRGQLLRMGVSDRLFRENAQVVRGLAYYTGMVFEVIAEGERAVAGGGRYDNLIELLGGPPTPAVGFAMGDVVLANLLDDKGLMPTGPELASAVETVVRSQRIRPEVLVTSNGDEATAPMVTPVVARLRRGIEAEGFAGRPWDRARYAVRPLHARTSTKNPKRLNKVLEDAEKQGARFAAIIHGDDKVQLRDLDRREDVRADLSVDPGASSAYVGAVLAKMLG